MYNIEFRLALNQNDTWNMSRLHFHDHYEFLLPLTSPGNIFVNDQVYPLERGTLYLIGENTLHRTMATGSHAVTFSISAGRPSVSCPPLRPISSSSPGTPSAAQPSTAPR